MRPIMPLRYLNCLILALTLALTSCGGGSNTAGAGGSGVGGTGITTVTGNISHVVAMAPQGERTLSKRMLAGVFNWLSTPVNAQAIQLGGIQVFGGGQSTTTGGDGRFELNDVAPSDNFTLRFVLEDNEENQTVVLPIGAVPAGSRVQVNDIVVNADQGFASAGDVEVKENQDDEDDQSEDEGQDDQSGDEGQDDQSEDEAEDGEDDGNSGASASVTNRFDNGCDGNADDASGNANENASENAGDASGNNNACNDDNVGT